LLLVLLGYRAQPPSTWAAGSSRTALDRPRRPAGSPDGCLLLHPGEGVDGHGEWPESGPPRPLVPVCEPAERHPPCRC